MARFRFILGCLVAGLFIQVAFAAAQGGVLGQTKHGLVLPGGISSSSNTQVSDQAAVEDASYLLQDAYADEAYIMELERQELEDIQHMVEEEQQKKAAELAAAAAADSQATESGGLKRLPVPFELSAAQPVMAMANTFSREVRNAVEQAQAMAAQLLKSQGTKAILTGSTSSVSSQQQQQEEAVPVSVIELAQTAGLLGSSSSGEQGLQIDVTVTTERTRPTFMLPSIFPSNMPAMFGFGGGSSSDSSAGSSSSSDSAKQVELAAEIAQSVIQSALASQAAGSGEQELVLDMTVEDAGPQSAQKLVAAAAAAAASAAASAALNKQPWDTLELEMEVVETTRPFFKSGRFAVIGTLLLMVQLLLCFAVAFLWAREADEEEEGECDEEHVDLKQQKQQEWASMAEEGRGLYEKLLSYT